MKLFPLLVKLFGPTTARVLITILLNRYIALKNIKGIEASEIATSDIAETLADSLNIGDLVDKITDEGWDTREVVAFISGQTDDASTTQWGLFKPHQFQNNQAKVAPPSWQIPSQLEKRRSLYLSGTQVNDVSLLAGSNNLEILDLDRTPVENITSLAELNCLEALYLNETLVHDVSPLAGLMNLQTLSLNKTGVRDVQALANLSRLTSLYLNETAVNDVSPLAGLSNLKILGLAGTPINNVISLAGLPALRFGLSLEDVVRLLPQLKKRPFLHLSLSDMDVNKDLAPLAELKNLQSLYLTGLPVSDISPLAGLGNLRILDLMGTFVNDVKPLASLSNLKALYLNRTQIDNVKPLATLSNLKYLYLRGTAVNDLTPLKTLVREGLEISQ